MSVLSMEKVDPKSLTDKDFEDIHYFTQDLWAEGSSELIKCHACDRISGKKEVFPYISKNIYQETVSRIFTILEQEFPITCPNCSSRETEIIHKADETIEIIKRRVLGSIESSMVIMRESVSREIVGYMEAYLDIFDNAFNLELKPHYPGISSQDMQSRIESLLQRDVSTIIIFSVLGISSRYRTPLTLARLLRYFSEVTVFRNEETRVGLMEIGRDNVSYKLFMHLGGVSLDETDPAFFRQHLKASSNYDSVIALFAQSAENFRGKFVRNSVREILN